MEKKSEMSINIDDLVKKIEKRIQELEAEEKRKKERLDNTVTDLDAIIREIDARIEEMEREENKSIDLDKISAKVNEKMSEIDDAKDAALEKTIYDLNEITKKINETIAALEKKKKDKKRKKAMYCDLARRNGKCNKKKGK